MSKTSKCDEATRHGRHRKAETFLEQARMIVLLSDNEVDVADAAVTLFVHAGIAAADVICCARLGVHSRGDSHSDAVALLERVDSAASNSLRVLLGLKTQAGYSALRTTENNLKRAERAAHRLVAMARAMSS